MAETKKAKTKAELLAEKMEQKRVAQTAFEAGAKPIVDTNPPEIMAEPAQDAPNTEEVAKDTPKAKEPPKSTQDAQNGGQEPRKGSKASKDTTKAKNAATAKKTASDSKESAPARLLDILPKRKRIEKKTNAYYISVANIERLDKAAAQAGTSASDLLDNILTAVLSE